MPRRAKTKTSATVSSRSAASPAGRPASSGRKSAPDTASSAKSASVKAKPAISKLAKSKLAESKLTKSKLAKFASARSRAVNGKALPAAQTSGAQPLDLGALPTYIGYRLRRAQISAFDDFIRCAAAAGLRPAQFSTLIVINANPGSKQTQVAHALGIKGTNFVAMVNELERRELIERRASDRRSHALHLTAKGRQALASVIRNQDALEREYDRLLGPGGREKLLEMLEALCATEL